MSRFFAFVILSLTLVLPNSALAFNQVYCDYSKSEMLSSSNYANAAQTNLVYAMDLMYYYDPNYKNTSPYKNAQLSYTNAGDAINRVGFALLHTADANSTNSLAGLNDALDELQVAYNYASIAKSSAVSRGWTGTTYPVIAKLNNALNYLTTATFEAQNALSYVQYCW